MNTTFKLLTILLLSLTLFPACYYDVEEELYPDNNCNLDNVTYSETILDIIQENCYACHSSAAQQGGVVLEGYPALKVYVDSGQLLGAIKQDSGFSPMPQGQPMLDDCAIQKIDEWILNGAINN